MQSVTKQVVIKNIRFKYHVGGTGPPLVFIPALHTTYTRFVDLIDILSTKHTVYYPDLPGIGTRDSLGDYTHTCKNYGVVVAKFIKHLSLTDYTISGLCMGAVIVLRAMQCGANPKKVVLIEPIYDACYYRVPFIQKLGSHIGGLLATNKLFLALFNGFISSDVLLGSYFRVVLHKQDNAALAVKYQINQTRSMHPRAFLELVHDMSQLHLSQEDLVYDTATLIIRHSNDEHLRLEETVAGIQTIFPNSSVHTISFDRHSAKTPLPNTYNQEVADIMLGK